MIYSRRLTQLPQLLNRFRGFLRRAGVMCPDGEAPPVAADEVGVEVSRAQVVDRLVLARVQQILDGQPAAVVAAQQVPRPQLSAGHPAPAAHPEGVLPRRAD